MRSDRGSEMINSDVKKLMKRYHINHFYTNNEHHACHAERVIKTFRNLLHRYFTASGTYNYLPVLQKLVKNYNSTPHKSLGYTAPRSVNKSNERHFWKLMYLTKKTDPTKKQPIRYKFKIGSLVRITHLKWAFERDYHAHFSIELFKVNGRYIRDSIPVYKLVDLAGDAVLGTFYNSELQRVTGIDENSNWKVEKILNERKTSKGVICLIRWQGYPKKFDSWVNKREILDI